MLIESSIEVEKKEKEDRNKDFQKTQIISSINKIKYKEEWTLPTVEVEKIVDWESRIADYSEEVKQIYYQGF